MCHHQFQRYQSTISSVWEPNVRKHNTSFGGLHVSRKPSFCKSYEINCYLHCLTVGSPNAIKIT